MPQTQISWTPAETYALQARTTRQWVIAQILDGHLNGVVSASDWYVLNFEGEEWSTPTTTTPWQGFHETGQAHTRTTSPVGDSKYAFCASCAA